MIDWVIVGAGAFCVCGAAMDWERFMNHRKAQPFVDALGRGGARAFYVVLGGALVAFGAMKAMGMIGACAR